MFKKLLILTSLIAVTTGAQAALVNADPNNLVTNGSFDDAIGNSIYATGWSQGTNNGEATNTADIINAGANFGVLGTTDFAAAPSATPDGENWVGIARDGALQNEIITQNVTGFTIGATYEISWYEANFGYDVVDPNVDFLSANAVEATLGSDYTFDGGFIATGSDWLTRSFTFTANQTNYDLSFGLINPARSYLSLDGVSIVEVAAVPEPSTWAMLLAGGLLVFGSQRKQRKTH